MTPADVVMAVGAYVIGGLLVAAGWSGNRWFFSLPKAAWLERQWGSAAARWLVALLGLVLIGMGCSIQF